MSTTTDNLKFFVYEPQDDGSQTFNITTSMTENFQKIDKMLNLYSYDSTFTYSAGMHVLKDGVIYRSKANSNTGKALSNSAWWEIMLYDNTQDLMNALVKRKSTSQATGSVSRPVYVKADGTVEECNDIPDISKSFVAVNQTLSAGVQTSLTSLLPSDNNIYLIWVYNYTSVSSNTAYGSTIETDIFPERRFTYTDGDSGRESKSVGIVCVPVGSGRYVTVSRSSTLIGYMKA